MGGGAGLVGTDDVANLSWDWSHLNMSSSLDPDPNQNYVHLFTQNPDLLDQIVRGETIDGLLVSMFQITEHFVFCTMRFIIFLFVDRFDKMAQIFTHTRFILGILRLHLTLCLYKLLVSAKGGVFVSVSDFRPYSLLFIYLFIC